MTLLGIGTLQVAMVCVWRLLTMVDRSTVFSRDAFRYVDAIAVAAAAATALALVAADAVQPGAMLAVMGAAVGGAGAALLVVVLRALLIRAVELDAETAALHAELDEVI
ncbi:DUF2975 domain-containing protein [Xylanimonas sp. McL0601]|uniref:DUF2975 domain-containing protein n=1 Tax=Xylanimonas sp. McL0601 TaxID=3414739 RepID=UPI003CF28C60